MSLRLDKVTDQLISLDERVKTSKDTMIKNGDYLSSLKVILNTPEETIVATPFFPMSGRSAVAGWAGYTVFPYVIAEPNNLYGLVEQWVSYSIYLSNIAPAMIPQITPTIIVQEASDVPINRVLDLSYDVITSTQHQYLYYNSFNDNRLLITTHYHVEMNPTWTEEFKPYVAGKASVFKDGKDANGYSIEGYAPTRGFLPLYKSMLILRIANKGIKTT